MAISMNNKNLRSKKIKTHVDWKALIEAYRQGYLIEDIARAYRLSVTWARRLLINHTTDEEFKEMNRERKALGFAIRRGEVTLPPLETQFSRQEPKVMAAAAGNAMRALARSGDGVIDRPLESEILIMAKAVAGAITSDAQITLPPMTRKEWFDKITGALKHGQEQIRRLHSA